MPLQGKAAKAIEDYLSEWFEPIYHRHDTKNSTPDDSKNRANFKPIHSIFMSLDALRISSFERTFSTTLGTALENCACLIANNSKSKMAKRNFHLVGQVSKKAIAAIDNIVADIDHNGVSMDYQESVEQVVQIAKNDTGATIHRKIISDIYMKTDDGIETFFEFKTPKCNKDQCLIVTKKHLTIHAMKKDTFPNVRTHFGLHYHPYGEGNKYAHISKKYLDMNNHVLLGKALWDYIGGNNAYEDLLQIFNKVSAKYPKYI